ncbi:hypothetical protein I79_007206 [Cricetulus griseus]|uniref:Uncharacterized protein n=1 Tax=Cricetulus griseus TaxID=10029 RepID=G3H9X5_CRIGR|nr:hypothetical protein I79_007206 [Cricetulus griseus]
MGEDYVGTVCLWIIQTLPLRTFLLDISFKIQFYGIHLKIATFTVCGCKIWSLSLDFLLSIVKCMNFSGTPEEEGAFIVLTFTVWWFLRTL